MNTSYTISKVFSTFTESKFYLFFKRNNLFLEESKEQLLTVLSQGIRMKTGFITIGLLLLLVCLPISVPASKANIVTNEGTTAAYQPYIISPSNMGYYSNVLTLNVSFRSEVWANVKYAMVYSLDGQENKSLPLTDHYFSWVQGQHDKCYDDGSVTLPELSAGSHNITVYLQCDWAIGYSTNFVDYYYNDSQTVFFTIIDPAPSPSLTPTLSTKLSPTASPFPSSYPEQPFLMPTESANQTLSNNVIDTINPYLVLCSIAAILAVATFAFVYFKKRK
jgi:hypothetical protein